MSEDITDLKKGVVGDTEWLRRWREGESHWHKDIADTYLTENGAVIFGDAKKRIFIPLCGKSRDLLWFYRQGHDVVGVELADKAVLELFQENSIDFTVETLQGLEKTYKSTDGQLTVFTANLFHVPAEKYGKFDVIWDCKSFTAINLDDHIRYRDLIFAVMKPAGVYYLKTLQYDESVWPGPPHSISDQAVKETFGDTCTIEMVEELKSGGPGIATSEPKQVQNKKSEQGADLTNTSGKVSGNQFEGITKEANEVSKEEDQQNKENVASDIIKAGTKEHPTVASAAQIAIKQSSFRDERWYKLILKQKS